MKKKELIRRFVTNVLYAGLEQGDVGFLKKIYNKLKLHDMIRISEMRIKWNKISSKAANAVYEDIIGIIVEEVCQKSNKELLADLMRYYLKRFPDVQKSIEDFGDDIEGLLKYQLSIYPFAQGRDEDEGEHRISAINDNFSESGSDYADFLKRSLILLYAITTCKDNSTATSAISSETPIKWDFFIGGKKVYNHFTTFKLSPDMVCHKKTAALPFVCKFAFEGKGLIKFCPLRIIITIGLRWEEMILEQIIKQIIECENKEYDEFMEYQEKRLLELKELQKRKKRGEDIDLSSVLSGLRKSGILDSKNNIAMPYLAVLGKER